MFTQILYYFIQCLDSALIEYNVCIDLFASAERVIGARTMSADECALLIPANAAAAAKLENKIPSFVHFNATQHDAHTSQLALACIIFMW